MDLDMEQPSLDHTNFKISFQLFYFRISSTLPSPLSPSLITRRRFGSSCYMTRKDSEDRLEFNNGLGAKLSTEKASTVASEFSTISSSPLSPAQAPTRHLQLQEQTMWIKCFAEDVQNASRIRQVPFCPLPAILNCGAAKKATSLPRF